MRCKNWLLSRLDNARLARGKRDRGTRDSNVIFEAVVARRRSKARLKLCVSRVCVSGKFNRCRAIRYGVLLTGVLGKCAGRLRERSEGICGCRALSQANRLTNNIRYRAIFAGFSTTRSTNSAQPWCFQFEYIPSASTVRLCYFLLSR